MAAKKRKKKSAASKRKPSAPSKPKPQPKRTPKPKAKKRKKQPSKSWKQPKAWTKEDGSLARHYSKLRELPKRTRKKVRDAIDEHEGEPDFDVFMYEVADWYEVEIGEVYTFWMSE